MIRKRFLAILLAFALVLSGFTPALQMGVQRVYAAGEISTWADLREAVDGASDGAVIKLSKDIVAEGATIDIGSKKITIQGPDGNKGVTIWRKAGDANFPMFTSSAADAELTLGKNLTLTGQVPKGTCPPAAGFTVTYTNGAGKSGTKDFTAPQEVYINRPAADWTPENGYEFKGWKFKTSASGSAQSTRENQDICSTGFNVPAGKTGEMKLVAEYEKKDFKVIWSNGVSGDGEKTTEWSRYATEQDKIIQTGALRPYTPPDDWAPEEGYVFVGWKFKRSENADSESTKGTANIYKPDFNVTTDMVAEMKIVAQWEKPASGGGSGPLVSIEDTPRKLIVDYYTKKVQLYNTTDQPGNKEILNATIESDGRIKATSSSYTTDHYIYMFGAANPTLTDATQNNYLIAHSDTGGENGTIATSSSNPIYLYDTYGKKYLSGFGTQWATGGTPLKFYIDGGGGGTPTPYDSSDPSYTPKQPEVYPTTDEPTYSDQAVSQGCDGNCTTYTKDDFAGETTENPRGFFIQVEAGTVTLTENATLTDFITDDTIVDAAPVCVKGGTFNMNGNSKITGNSVGYSADNTMSDEQPSVIGTEHRGKLGGANKGDADSRNAWNYTRTAGGVIYTNGASGTIEGNAEIKNNRGDAGGIIVQGRYDDDRRVDGGKYYAVDGYVYDRSGSYSAAPTQSSVTVTGNAHIDNNAGVHYAGGAYVYNNAALYLNGSATIDNNWAWSKGGGVWTSAEVYGSSEGGAERYIPVGEAIFVMADNSSVSGNFAALSGGGIQAMSNGVNLISGKISNNSTRHLGGGMYVPGDGSKRMYTVYIANGCITDNHAVSWESGTRTIIDKTLEDTSGCGFENIIGDNSSKKTSYNGVKYNGRRTDTGAGGGVWLCSMGGNASLGSDAQHNVIIDGNTASTEGNDIIFLSSAPNAGSGFTFIDNTQATPPVIDNNKWKIEGTDNTYVETGKLYPGILSVTNEINASDVGQACDDNCEGMLFKGNYARGGGAIAANGTVIFGTDNDVYKFNSAITITKSWDEKIDPRENVKLTFNLTDENGNVLQPLDGYSLDVDGEADPIDPNIDHSAIETTTETDNQNGQWVGEFSVPTIAVDPDGKIVSLFQFESGGKYYDPARRVGEGAAPAGTAEDPFGIVELYEALESGTITKANTVIKNWRIEVTETMEDGSETVYWFNTKDVIIDELSHEPDENPYIIRDKAGNPTSTIATNLVRLSMTQGVENNAPEEPEIEKYVNQAVHDYINLDEVFTYDVLAYVTKNADKVTITDKLVEDLEFVETESITVCDLGVGDDSKPVQSNHKPVNDVNGIAIDGNDDASVAQAGKDITTEDGVSVTTEDGLLTVTLDDEVTTDEQAGTQTRKYQTVENLRGHWVKVTFKAQIKKDLQNKINNGEMKLTDLKSVTVEGDKVYEADPSIFDDGRPAPNVGNAPVESDETHKGIDNTASYVIVTNNDGEYKDESNTVTVKPEKPEVEKYVNQAVHKNIALDEVFTYDIIGFITRDADKIVIEDTLVSCLEFVNVDGIKVETIADNNHKPVNDVNGSVIPDSDDASVAEAGTNIKDADGVTVEVVDNTLTVTIDDGVNPETGEREKGKTVLNNRGKYVRVTFQAQIKEEIQNDIKSGNMTIEKLLADGDCTADVAGDDNGNVLSDEAHDGIKNDAKMRITVENEGEYNLESNTVTVKPEQPEIEKYVNQAVHDYIVVDEVFTYDIIAYITNNADKFEITDTLVADLEFVSEASDVQVVDLGTENNHKPVNDVNGIAIEGNDDATVAEAGKTIDKATVSINADTNTLTVSMDDQVDPTTGVRQSTDVKDLRGHWVKVTFKAQIKQDLQDSIKNGAKPEDVLTFVEIKDSEKNEDRDAPNVGNDPVVSDEDHTGVDNTASYTIGVTNVGEYSDESNTVTVKPEIPEIEKYVSNAVHDHIELEEVFSFQVLAYITNNADKVTISDQLAADLEFANEKVTISDLGTDNNHKPEKNTSGMVVSDDATVVNDGDEVTNKPGVDIQLDDGKLTVVLDDKVTVDSDAGTISREYTTVKDLRGHWVKVTFNAQIKKELQDKINAGEMSIDELTSVTVKATEEYKADDTIFEDGRPVPNVGNAPVVSDEDHSGIPNTANYTIETDNQGTYQDESNTVTVKPEKPEIEKYVEKDVHKDIDVNDVFTYDVIAYVTSDADKITIKDELVSDLEFVSTSEEVKVVNLGAATKDNVDHNPNGEAVNAEGEAIAENIEINIDNESNTLEVIIDDNVSVNEETGTIERGGETVLNLRGCWIKVTFQAKIAEDKVARIKKGEDPRKVLEYANIIDTEEEDRTVPNVGNDPVNSDLNHTGIPNKANYTVEVFNAGEYYDESNTVTVKPEGPEIEKYINQAVHKDIALDEVFTYDVIAYVTNDAEEVIITDELNKDLEFVGDATTVKVVDLGEDNNHKVTNDITATQVNDDATVGRTDGEEMKDAEPAISGRKLTVTIADAKPYRGHWVRVTFQCRIKEGKEIKDLKYSTVVPDEVYEDSIVKGDRTEPNVGNAPVDSNEQHTGVPNTASYVIKIDNKAKYEDVSNTVTVKPQGPEIEKYVNQAVHKDIKFDEEFTYDILAFVTDDADSVTITDTIDDILVFVGAAKDVVVEDLGEGNNHKVQREITAKEVNSDATVARTDGKKIAGAKPSIDGKTLTVEIADAKAYRGHWVRVTFKASIDPERDLSEVVKTYKDVKADKVYKDPISKGKRAKDNVGNAPVVSDEDHTGVPNTASYEIKVGNKAKYNDTSNTVTVKPERETISIPVIKNWDEYLDDDSKRPTSITINLLANGKKVGEPLVLTEGDSWAGTFDNLDKYDDKGIEIEYTVEEVYVDYYYYDIIVRDKEYVVQNHMRPWIPKPPTTPGDVGHVKVSKTVSGLAEEDKAYDIQVKFTYKNGTTYTHDISLKPSDDPFLFDYIPVGTKVEVTEVTTGYDMTCTVDGIDATEFDVEIGKTHEVVINNDKPENPDQPKTPDKPSKKKAPKSGDESTPLFWLGILALAGLGIGTLRKNMKRG